MELFKKKKKWSEQSNVAKAFIFTPSKAFLSWSTVQNNYSTHQIYCLVSELARKIPELCCTQQVQGTLVKKIQNKFVSDTT